MFLHYREKLFRFVQREEASGCFGSTPIPAKLSTSWVMRTDFCFIFRLKKFCDKHADLTITEFGVIHQEPLCLRISSKSAWQLAHVWQPGTAARRGAGMSSPHSVQCSADTALRSMR